MPTPIERAVDYCKGPTKLARAVGVSVPTVIEWVSGDRPVPIARCAAIEAATDGTVTCEELCSTVKWNRDRRGKVTGYTVAVAA